MCLDTGTELKKTDRKPEYGWKAFSKNKGSYKFPCYPHNKEYAVPTGRWLTARREPIAYEGPMAEMDAYEAGFHVFKTRKAAVKWMCSEEPASAVFVKVRIKGVRIRGVQEGHVVYVADKMLVPKPKRKKKK